MEAKDILETLDLGDIKDIDGLKKAFNEKFIPKSHVMEDESVKKSISEKIGKTTGAFTTLAKREFGLTSEEIEGKKWEDIFSLGMTKKKAEIDELKATMGSGADEKVTTLTKNLEKKDKEFNDLKELLDKTTQTVTVKDQELTKKTEEFTNQMKALKIGVIKDKAKEKIAPKLKDGISEAEKFYFDSKIEENFLIDFDDKGEVVVSNKEGKRIQNPNKVGAFMSLEEALESQAAALNLAKKNNGSGIDLKKIYGQGGEGQNNNAGQNNGQGLPGRKLHPNALKAAEMAGKK